MRMMTAATKAGLLVALCALGIPGSAASQDARARVEREECRCVDRDGNAIENCTCMRMPRIEVVRGQLAGMMTPRRAQIGVWIADDQSGEAERQGGALLSEVQEDGPAAEAGLRAGDIVLRVDGRALSEPLPDLEEEEELDLEGSIPVQRFVRLVGRLEPGEPVDFEILRDGSRRNVSVTPEAAVAFGVRVGEGPLRVLMDNEAMRMDMEEVRQGAERLRVELERMREREGEPGRGVWQFRVPDAPATPGEPARGTFTFLRGDPCFEMERREGQGWTVLAGGGNCVDGVDFLELNEELAEYFDAEEGGVLVTEVAEASTLGLRAGDVLVAVDGREVRDADHVRRILSSYDEDEEIRLRVIRKGSEIEVLGRRRDG